MIDSTNQGKRVRLLFTNDPYTRLKKGSLGTYKFSVVDAFNTINHFIQWDNGSTLTLLGSVDRFEFVKEGEKE